MSRRRFDRIWTLACSILPSQGGDLRSALAEAARVYYLDLPALLEEGVVFHDEPGFQLTLRATDRELVVHATGVRFGTISDPTWH
jgi:hypothetical protein